MRLVTFQPKWVLDKLQSTGSYSKEVVTFESLGSDIYCMAYNESLLERIFVVAPSMPQVGIVFDTDVYEEVDSVKHANYVASLNRVPDSLFSTVSRSIGVDKSTKYVEYVVKSIDLKDFVSSMTVSDSDDEDEVQNDFMNFHLVELEKDSSYMWRRCGDKEMESFWQSDKAFEFVQKVTNCMIPIGGVLSNKDYDEAISFIRKCFRLDK